MDVVETLVDFIKANKIEALSTERTLDGFKVFVTIEKVKQVAEE